MWILESVGGGAVRLSSTVDVLVCGGKKLVSPIRREYTGSIGPMYVESSCVLDANTGRVFIYGGWNEDMHWCATDMTGTYWANDGRYSAQCIELSLNEGTIRTIEAASHIAGPGKRAKCILGMFENRLLITGGYHSLDADDNQFFKAHTFRTDLLHHSVRGGFHCGYCRRCLRSAPPVVRP